MKLEKESVIREVEEFNIDASCFTLSEFAKYLTSKFTKKSKAAFTPHEAREFAIKGRLPSKYGGTKLEFIEVKDTGVKFVKVVEEIKK